MSEEEDKKSLSEVDNRAKVWPQALAAVSTSIGAFALGCGLAWTSPVLPHLEDCEDNPDKPEGCDFPGEELSSDEASWVGSTYTLGAIASGLVTGILIDRLGRKGAMLAMAVPMTAGWLLLSLVYPLELVEVYWLYIGRILTGFGAGSFSMVSPIYIVEVAEPGIRGSLAILMQFMVTSGNVFTNGFGAFMEWYNLTYIILAIPVIMAVMMSLMPESPYVLLQKGKDKRAEKSLQWLRGKSYDVSEELSDIKDAIKAKMAIKDITLRDLFTRGVYLKPFLIMLVIHFVQQFSGINAVVFYLSDIFLKAGFDVDKSLQDSAYVSLTQVAATGASIFLVERTGRKILLMVSSAGMSVSICALGLYFYFDEHREVTCEAVAGAATTVSPACVPEDGFSQDMIENIESWLPLTSLIAYKFFFAIGYGPLPWSMNGEFFSLEAKSLTTSILVAFNWTCAFIVTKFETNVEDAIGTSGAYFIYASVCFVATFFVFFVVPETKGKSPQEMKALFEK